MPDYKFIYQYQAEQYDRLVAHEDYQHNLIRVLNQISSMRNVDVVEFGAGTGRLTLMLASQVRSIIVSDISRSMLMVALQKLQAWPRKNWQAVVADNRAIPLPDQCADVSIAGWSLGHTCGWYPGTWPSEIKRAVDQMQRLLRSNGALIILESLGTGSEVPHPPTAALAAYYSMLENELGFKSIWLRTDYHFKSVAEAGELTRFFFGDGLADRVVRDNVTILPECTGLWYRTS